MTFGPAAGLFLGLSAPAAAAHPGESMPAMPAAPAYPGAPVHPGGPDMRPVWQGSAGPMLPDPRTRDAWLDECQRRTALYYGNYRKSRRHRDDWRRDDRAYSYCEAYFDDYYRNAYRGHGYAYAMPVVSYAVPMVQVPVAQAQTEQCREVVTTEYVTVRRRVIPRRPAPRPRYVVPDKRIRVVPDKRLPLD